MSNDAKTSTKRDPRPLADLVDAEPGSYLRFPKPGDQDVLYLIDLHCWMHRYFATMKGGATRGFAGFLANILRFREPKYIAVCADPGGNTFRHDLAPTIYKAKREPPDPRLLERIRWAREISEDVFGVRVYRRRGFEADDIIATLTKAAKADGLRVVIVAIDKDLMQLVDNKVFMWDGKAGIVGPPEASKKFHGLRSYQISDYLAIVGDQADNIPGIPGLGPVAAATLLKEFATLEEAMKVACSAYGHPFYNRNKHLRETLRKGKASADISAQLTALRFDVPVDYNRDDLTIDEACKR